MSNGHDNGNGNVPLIGGHKVKATVQAIVGLVRDMDENAQFDPERVQLGPGGMPIAVAGRSSMVSAQELVEMIRIVVREEIRAAQKETK